MSDPPASVQRTRILPLLAAELRRRGVLRAAGIYVVGAWVAMQGADLVFSTFGFSQRWVALVIVVAIAGFPLVVVFSWVFRVGVDLEVAPSEIARAGPRMHAAVLVPTLVGLALLGAGGWLALRGGARGASAPAASLDRIAILYFSDLTHDPAHSYLGPAITGALIDHLGGVEGLTVVSRNGVAPYRDHAVPPDSLGRALGVGVLVTGSVMQSHDQVQVAAELTDARAGTLLKSVRVHRPAADPVALVNAVVAEVGDSVVHTLGREIQRQRWRAGTRDVDAWRLLQQAAEHAERSRALSAQRGLDAALSQLAAADSLLAAAERRDPAYLDAIAERAQTAYWRGLLLVRRGDPGTVAQALRQGEAHASRALTRDPRYAPGHELRGVLREFRHTFAPPRDPSAAARLLNSAEIDLREAIRLEPRRGRALATLSAVLDQRGAFAEALVYLEEAYRVDAFQRNATGIVDRLFTINFELGRDEAAVRWCRELRRRTWPSVQAAVCELQLQAWSERSPPDVRVARDVVRAAVDSEGAAAGPAAEQHLNVLLAGVMARAGQADSARALLERARAEGDDQVEILQLEAGVRLLLGEEAHARRLLQAYGRNGPGALLASSRRFARLADNPLTPPAR